MTTKHPRSRGPGGRPPGSQPTTRSAPRRQSQGNWVPIRGVLAVTGTALGLVLLLSFKTQAPAMQGEASRPPQVAAASPSAESATDRPSSDPAGASTPPAIGAIPTPTQRPTGRPTPPPTQKPATADVNGPVEQTPYGSVQVEVKVQGGRLVDVVALQLPFDRRRSAEISQYVEPILHDEALQAQSSQIDLISGATWTSSGYQASLQAALGKVQ